MKNNSNSMLGIYYKGFFLYDRVRCNCPSPHGGLEFYFYQYDFMRKQTNYNRYIYHYN